MEGDLIHVRRKPIISSILKIEIKMKLLLYPLLLFLVIPAFAQADFEHAISDLEAHNQAKIGVALVSENGNLIQGYRANERFAMCSTFKLPLAALVLSRIDAGEENPERKLHYDSAFLEEYAPAAKRYVATGYMTVTEAIQSALQLSDNAAANLLLKEVGGPPLLTKYFRSLGDKVSRLDRIEPTLNTNTPGDERDTTTPMSMAQTVSKLIFGDTLTYKSKGQLRRLLIGNQTGDKTIRAGLPDSWVTGDKTGSCANGGRNDVAFFITTAGKKYVLSVYTNAPELQGEERALLIASVAKLARQYVVH